jgi:hypothetical protein
LPTAALRHRWAVKPEVSAAAAPDLMAHPLWWFDGYCRIGKMYKARAVYVQAHCFGKGDVPVTLDAHGDRMRVSWNRARAEELRRCK